MNANSCKLNNTLSHKIDSLRDKLEKVTQRERKNQIRNRFSKGFLVSKRNDRRKKLCSDGKRIECCNNSKEIRKENESLNLKECRKYVVKKEREALTT